MADVLDQTEVDALLAAIDSGGVETTEAPSRRPAGKQTAAPPYDFRRPERVSKDQMRAIEGIHEVFARNFGASLSGFLRTIVEVRVATTEQLTYSEFIHSLPNPTNFNLLTAAPLDGRLCLEISPLIIYPIIDRLLGGSTTELFIPQRPLTVIEQRLVGRITDRALANLTEAWADLAAVTFEIVEVESNPHLVQIVAPSEIVVVVGFEIRIGTRVGTMSLCMPFKVIEPVMSKLVTRGWLAYQRQAAREDCSETIARGLAATDVDVTAFLAQTSITVSELLSLQSGDILQTGKPLAAEMLLQVEGENLFAGKLGRHRGNLAVRITRRAEVEEPL